MEVFRPDQRALLLIPVFLLGLMAINLLEFQRAGVWTPYSEQNINLVVVFLISTVGVFLVTRYTFVRLSEKDNVRYSFMLIRQRIFSVNSLEKIERISMYRGLPAVGKSAFFTVRKQDGSVFTFRLDENFFGKDRIVLLIKKLLEKNPTIEVDSYYK